jgi:hypothetical protein
MLRDHYQIDMSGSVECPNCGYWYELTEKAKPCPKCGHQANAFRNAKAFASVNMKANVTELATTGTGLPRYKEQLERVERWYERFERIDTGTAHEKSAEYYHDEVYAFFLNCYHLKDWIKNDTGIAENARNSVESFVAKSANLSICRDICNSLKHLELREKPRTGAQWGRRLFKLQLGGSPVMAVKYSIATVSGETDAFVLATKCVQEWKQFTKSNIT